MGRTLEPVLSLPQGAPLQAYFCHPEPTFVGEQSTFFEFFDRLF